MQSMPGLPSGFGLEPTTTAILIPGRGLERQVNVRGRLSRGAFQRSRPAAGQRLEGIDRMKERAGLQLEGGLIAGDSLRCEAGRHTIGQIGSATCKDEEASHASHLMRERHFYTPIQRPQVLDRATSAATYHERTLIRCAASCSNTAHAGNTRSSARPWCLGAGLSTVQSPTARFGQSASAQCSVRPCDSLWLRRSRIWRCYFAATVESLWRRASVAQRVAPRLHVAHHRRS